MAIPLAQAMDPFLLDLLLRGCTFGNYKAVH